MSPFGYQVCPRVVIARYEGHGVEYRPKVAENGYTERTRSAHQVFSQPIWSGLGIAREVGTGASDQAEYPDVGDTPRSKGRWESQRIG
jgi:hypothetical protein